MKILSRRHPREFGGKKMAYLRKEKETVEIAYPLNKVWTAIPKALTNLEWNVEQIDDTTHRAKAKTKAGFMSYGSVLLIEAVPVDEKTARVSVAAETPVTTITAVVDFGRTRDRIELFFEELAKQLAS
jgi:hypothetical protein